VVSILEGINPRMLEAKLNGFIRQAADRTGLASQPKSAPQSQARRAS
jgi:flagellar motor component MotA